MPAYIVLTHILERRYTLMRSRLSNYLEELATSCPDDYSGYHKHFPEKRFQNEDLETTHITSVRTLNPLG